MTLDEILVVKWKKNHPTRVIYRGGMFALLTRIYAQDVESELIFWLCAAFDWQEYIRRQLEEEQRHLEILQQQLLHEQAMLLVSVCLNPKHIWSEESWENVMTTFL